ncbi:MAG: RHS repeat-associated core domain-containing protein, partial [bacterium]|nr:RHS repeat-associated core domain-containing protein [bacterium]
SLTATVGLQVFTTTYGYDELNRLETVTAAQGGVTAIAYDENGNQASLVFPNSLTTDFTYDQLNRLTDLSTASDVGNVLQSYAYTLGAVGNRIRVDEHDGTSRHYLYDDLYRLTQDRVTEASSALVYQRDFVYDAVGNRTEQTIDEGTGPTAVDSTYDDRDRLLTAATAAYGWDANGNLTSRVGTSYGWDYENRLTSATLADGTVVETTYDADGNRVRTAFTSLGGPTAVVDYLVDTTGFLSHVVADVVDGLVATYYTRADDQLIGLYSPASETKRYYHADGLGSIRALSDEIGQVTDRYTYTAFGELLEHGGTSLQEYQFAGEPLDPNLGFYYNRSRWLDVSAGRFASLDLLPANVFEPKALHRYQYAVNEPTLGVDPTGLFVDFSLKGFTIAVAVSGLVEAGVNLVGGQATFGSLVESFFLGAILGGATYVAGVGLLRAVARAVRWASGLRKARMLSALYSRVARLRVSSRFGGQYPAPECVNCSIEVAGKLGLSKDLVSEGLEQLVRSGRDGIVNVLPEGSRALHFVVKAGDKIIDRTILANIKYYNAGKLPRALAGLTGDTFLVEEYHVLRSILFMTIGPL